MNSKKRILLKLTGTLLEAPSNGNAAPIISVVKQIKQLSATHQFGIVIGGGNLFRGSQHGKHLGIKERVGHYAGMLATMMNGLIIQDVCGQHALKTTLFTALPCPTVGKAISPQAINDACADGHTIIFSGGTGNPFVTTDTNALIRALQMDALQVFKGTYVDGVYDADPRTHANAKRLARVSYYDALTQQLGIMDTTAYALGQQHNMPIRVFDIFAPNALVRAAQDDKFGSIIG